MVVKIVSCLVDENVFKNRNNILASVPFPKLNPSHFVDIAIW